MKKLLAVLVLAPALALAQAPPPEATWAVQHQPAAAAQATITRAAVTGQRHVATSLTVCLTAVAVQARVLFNLRDGATGAGTILWSASVALPAGQNYCVSAPVSIAGSKGTAMTLESASAPAATNFATVSLAGYTIRR